MMAPRYQEIPAARIPEATSADGSVRVRVLAGEALGQRAVIDTRTPITYLDIRLRPGAVFEQPIDAALRAFVYVVEGSRVPSRRKDAPLGHEPVLSARRGERSRPSRRQEPSRCAHSSSRGNRSTSPSRARDRSS